MPNGHIVDTRTIVDNGSPATRFDIVILGEGFQARQLRLFDMRAKLLATEMLALSPFDSVAHLINVHTVRTVSTDEGISNFPIDNVPKRTFFDVSGFFQVPGLPQAPATFMGTPTPEAIWDAAGLVAPFETLELFIVLVNVRDFAASTFPDQRMVFTALQTSTAEFVHLTAHECCHAIAKTAEEYLDCDGPQPGKTYPNQATEAERLAGTVKWKSLAKASELKASGDFKAVHRFGDLGVRIQKGTHTPVFKSKSLNGKLGLYVGCQDVDVTLPGAPCTDAYADPLGRGRHFYRPMAECKMRVPTSPFCRVCSDEMVKAIKSFAI